MVGVMVAAGRRIISVDDVRRMLEQPDCPVDLPDDGSDQSEDVYIVPSHGLYLANVEYDNKGLLPPPLFAFFF